MLSGSRIPPSAKCGSSATQEGCELEARDQAGPRVSIDHRRVTGIEWRRCVQAGATHLHASGQGQGAQRAAVAGLGESHHAGIAQRLLRPGAADRAGH